MMTQRHRPFGVLCLLAACSSTTPSPATMDTEPEAELTDEPTAAKSEAELTEEPTASDSEAPVDEQTATEQTASATSTEVLAPEGECITRAMGGLGNDFVKVNGVLCDPEQFPFVRSATAIAVGPAEVALRQPKPGTLCVNGTASTTELAWGLLGLEFSAKNLEQTEVFATFDATALGIVKLAFTLESAPSEGLNVDTASTTKLSCPQSPGDCTTPDEGFLLTTGPGSATILSLTEDGDYVFPFANFQQTRADGSRFDPTALEHFSFRTIGDFDFCITNFRLLDEDDQEVAP